MQTRTFTRLAAGALIVLLMPVGANAASSRPTCSLTITNGDAETTITKSEDLIVAKGTTLDIEWKSKNAKEAEDIEGEEIDLSDEDDLKITSDTKLEYTFTNGSRKAVCSATIKVVEVDVTSSLTTSEEKPTFSGTAEGLKKFEIRVTKEGSSKVVFKKSVSVKGGKWSVRSTKKLADGKYEVGIYGSSRSDFPLVTEKLSISEKGGDTTLAVVSIPLLSGGTTRAGATVPVSYLRMMNTGSASTTISGFWVKQNGSANTAAVTALSSIDDKGGSKGLTEGTVPFKNGTAFVPTSLALGPGQQRLFTLKAILGTNAGAYMGQNLMIDVTGIEADAEIKGGFPIRGTTWVIGY